MKKMLKNLFNTEDKPYMHMVAMILAIAIITAPIALIVHADRLNTLEAEFELYKPNYETIAAENLTQSLKLIDLQLQITQVKKELAELSQQVDANKIELQNQKIDNDQMSQQSLEFIFNEIWDAILNLERVVY